MRSTLAPSQRLRLLDTPQAADVAGASHAVKQHHQNNSSCNDGVWAIRVAGTSELPSRPPIQGVRLMKHKILEAMLFALP